MAEDEEDLRIEALRQELMREIDNSRNSAAQDIKDVQSSLRQDVSDLQSQAKLIKRLLGIGIAIVGGMITLLAFLANII